MCVYTCTPYVSESFAVKPEAADTRITTLDRFVTRTGWTVITRDRSYDMQLGAWSLDGGKEVVVTLVSE